MKYLIALIAILAVQWASAQDSLRTVTLDEVTVYGTRANEKTPTTFTEVSKKELKERNLGQDLPILLNFSPSVISSSDAGAGIGYTDLRIRGSDATRINVTINGVPLNDSESHGVFWVNMPDFSSSLSSIQIQRGVGTSSNGPGAFGATINLKTNNVSPEPFIQTDHSIGSFKTIKNNVVVNSGLINGLYNFEGRLSRIKSDGYIDRSNVDLKSYYFSGGRFGERTMIKAVVFGGKEITHQAWYGTPQARLTGNASDLQRVIQQSGEYKTPAQRQNLLNSGRRFNYYLYENEIDNYQQYHHQLHIAHTFNDHLTYSGAFHYTRGKGFFEQFKENDKLSKYGLSPITVGGNQVTRSNFIRRRWLDNHFYGFTYNLNYSKDKLDLTLGGAWNRYKGGHFGKVISTSNPQQITTPFRYYDGDGVKKDFNVFLKGTYDVSDRLNVFGDVQFRKVIYRTKGLDSDRNAYDVDTDLSFFNPKLGFTYSLNSKSSLYASYSIGNREPVRNDFLDADKGKEPKHETLRNLEAGIRSKGKKFSYEANVYYMNYKNQLVLTGAVNDVGAAIRVNVPKSYRLGIELSGAYQVLPNFVWGANLALSRNKIEEFVEIIPSASFKQKTHKDSDISLSPNIIGANSLDYEPIKNLHVQLLTKYVGKQFLDNTSDSKRSIDSYLTNDIRLSYDFSFGVAKNIGITLLINNVLNEKYSARGSTWGFYYNDNGTERLYQQNNYFPQAERNYLLGVSLKF